MFTSPVMICLFGFFVVFFFLANFYKGAPHLLLVKHCLPPPFFSELARAYSCFPSMSLVSAACNSVCPRNSFSLLCGSVFQWSYVL